MTKVLDTKHIIIGVSSCLLGENVRYDAGHKYQRYITKTLGQFFTFKSFCPEMAIGLGAPRETLQLVQNEAGKGTEKENGEEIRCVGTKTSTLDITDQLRSTAHEQRPWHQQLSGYILKKGSPSCGMAGVMVYQGSGAKPIGSGIYARVLQDNFPHLPIEEEGRLGDPLLRENFITRVFAYHHWQGLCEATFSMKALIEFHAGYKYLLLSHDQDKAQALGTRLENALTEGIEGDIEKSIDQIAAWYIETFMSILKLPATRESHARVLQRLQALLADELSAEDKQKVSAAISAYQNALLPLITPITLLRHHFKYHPNSAPGSSKYLQPHPTELKLFDSI